MVAPSPCDFLGMGFILFVFGGLVHEFAVVVTVLLRTVLQSEINGLVSCVEFKVRVFCFIKKKLIIINNN